jgi:hypothetical protein
MTTKVMVKVNAFATGCLSICHRPFSMTMVGRCISVLEYSCTHNVTEKSFPIQCVPRGFSGIETSERAELGHSLVKAATLNRWRKLR